jgi:hypothetical protein
VLREVECNHEREDDVKADICDGLFLKTHPLFSQDKQALQIIRYFDDAEVANALGSKAYKHNIGKCDSIIIFILLDYNF